MNRRLGNDIINALTEQTHDQLNVSRQTSEQLNSTYEVLCRMEQRQEQLGDELIELRHEHQDTTIQVQQILGQLFSMISALNPKDCSEIKENGYYYESGLYDIFPASSGGSFQVYCDMQTAGGGWTVNMSLNRAGVFLRNKYNNRHYCVLKIKYKVKISLEKSCLIKRYRPRHTECS